MIYKILDILNEYSTATITTLLLLIFSYGASAIYRIVIQKRIKKTVEINNKEINELGTSLYELQDIQIIEIEKGQSLQKTVENLERASQILAKEKNTVDGKFYKLLDEFGKFEQKLMYIIDFVENNVNKDLNDIIATENNNIGNDNEIDQAYWGYLREKVNTMDKAYITCKQKYDENKTNGIPNPFYFINDEIFIASILGSGAEDLRIKSNKFPPDFYTKIDKINKKAKEGFVHDFMFGISLNQFNTKFNHWHLFKDCYIKAFRVDVQKIHDLYISTCKNKQFNVIMDNEIIHEGEKELLKKQIEEGKVDEALQYLSTHAKRHRDIVTLQLARYNTMFKRTMSGIQITDTELAQLNHDVLALIENIYK